MAKPLVAITGASSGIGETFARKLAPDHDLLLIARRKDRLEALASELSAATDSQVEILVADLTVENDLQAAAERIAHEPRLILLINNAGFGTKGRFWQADLATQESMHKLHVMATVRLTHAALGNLVPRDAGGIINVASVAAFVHSAGAASYCATKAWMTSFTESLFLELKSVGSSVTVQALCPGFTYSEFHERMAVQRERLASKAFWMTAEQVVDASLQGLHRKKLFVVPGRSYQILTAVLTKLPDRLRLWVEGGASKRRRKDMTELPSRQTQPAIPSSEPAQQ